MSILVDALSLHPIAAPLAPPPPRQAPVTAVGERDGAHNERRESARGDRNRASAAFRSFLNAATLSGLTQTLGGREKPAPPVESARARKVPSPRETTVLSGTESEHLYRAAQTAKQGSDPRASEFLAATTRYAKSYFSVSGTFAKPGESLELSA